MGWAPELWPGWGKANRQGNGASAQCHWRPTTTPFSTTACALALLGEDESALDALQRAIEAGLAGGDWVARDPDWERLRTHPRFQMLAGQLAAS